MRAGYSKGGFKMGFKAILLFVVIVGIAYIVFKILENKIDK